MSMAPIDKLNNLFKNGWVILDSENLDYSNKLKINIFKKVQKIFGIKNNNPDYVLNNFHKVVKNLGEVELNEKKVKLIRSISKSEMLVELIFKSIESSLTNLLGRDLLVQKTINIVIQPPNDNNPTFPHRDAPPNSFYEIVLWIPLVDCDATKSMYLINLKDTKDSLSKLNEKNAKWGKFINNFKQKKKFPKIKFGQILVFLPYVFHGSEKNKTNETRFSLNIRFKNLFTPSGKKFPLHFFRIFKISKFTDMAIESSKREI